MKKISTLIVAVAAFCVALSSCSSKSSSPGEAAKLYAGYIADGQYDKFVGVIHLPDGTAADQKEQKEALKAMLNEKVAESLAEKGGLKSVEVLSETISDDGQSAYVEMLYTYGNGDTEDNDMDLVLQDGRWLVEMNK